MIVVTGAAGFIGSNIIKKLNALGIYDILAVDDLTDGRKYRNLAVVKYHDYRDYRVFLDNLVQDTEADIEAVFHQGACSDTTEWNGAYMMENNYEYSKSLLHYCINKKIPFIYASSAAVYGGNSVFNDRDDNQLPLNVYGYSKWKFDDYVKPYLSSAQSQIVGLRYFNVYGPHENHKGKMASVAFHFMNQLQHNQSVQLFSSYGGYADGAHQRDFIFIDDVVAMNIWFYKNPDKKGVFNCGTGKARSFNDIANTLIALAGEGEVEYIPFPEALKNKYQCFTQADLTALRETGYDAVFTALEVGLAHYFQWFHRDGQFHSATESDPDLILRVK